MYRLTKPWGTVEGKVASQYKKDMYKNTKRYVQKYKKDMYKNTKKCTKNTKRICTKIQKAMYKIKHKCLCKNMYRLMKPWGIVGGKVAAKYN